jgi:hypothetical protein
MLGGLLLLAGCATARPRPTPLQQLDRNVQSPLAQQIQRDAPAAYAEVAQAVRAAEQAATVSPAAMADRVAEADLALAWAATQARGARARARAAEADQRRREAETDAARMEQQATVLLREAEEQLAARRALTGAQQASATPNAVPPAERAQVAAEVRQQAALTLAAATLLGAADAGRARVETQLRQAEEAGRRPDATAALVAAGRAFLAAEALVRETREGRAPGAEATSGARLVAELSGTAGLEPRRDARGVVAVMRGLFGPRQALAPTARGRLETMARVIQGHGDARVRIEAYVGGRDRAASERAAQSQSRAVVDALVRAGVPATRLEPAGVYRLPGGSRSEDLVEIVLVLPAAD